VALVVVWRVAVVLLAPGRSAVIVCHVAFVRLVAINACPIPGVVVLIVTADPEVPKLFAVTVLPLEPPTSVLLVRVSVVARPTSVSVLVGKVNVPVLEMVEITGDVNVLLVRVSVVARPTNVSVLVGNVSVPVLEMVEITGDVNVLLVRVSVVFLATSVSVALGKVILWALVAELTKVLIVLPDPILKPLFCVTSSELTIVA